MRLRWPNSLEELVISPDRRIRRALARPQANNKGKVRAGPFKCPDPNGEGCAKWEPTLSKLKQHMRKHSRDRPFACGFHRNGEHCCKRFKAEQALQRHQLKGECSLFMVPFVTEDPAQAFDDVIDNNVVIAATSGLIQPPPVTAAPAE